MIKNNENEKFLTSVNVSSYSTDAINKRRNSQNLRSESGVFKTNKETYHVISNILRKILRNLTQNIDC